MLNAYFLIKIILVNGHARLIDPPSRASAWRYNFDTPADYNDNQGWCGGRNYQLDIAYGKCGICGDPWFDDPREHEAPGGKYATGEIVATYTKGQMFKASIQVTANHNGFFEFKVCPNNDVTTDPTQDCFDKLVGLFLILFTLLMNTFYMHDSLRVLIVCTKKSMLIVLF